MPQAFSYVRFSTDKQSLGDSLRRQLEKAEEYALQNNLTLDTKSYRDLGISAFKSRNLKDGALGTFLRAIESSLIPKGSTLIVESLDRISRAEITDALPLFMGIVNSGVTIVTLADETPQVYTREKINADHGMTLFGSMMVLLRAHEESKTKSQRVKAAIQKKQSDRAINRKCPAWLKVNAAATEYILDSEKVAIVQMIFRMSFEGSGIWTIYQYLNNNKVPQLGKAKSGWLIPAVARLLHNQAVIGRMVSLANNTVIEDYYPSIIDRNVFFAVQEKMAERRDIGKGRKGDQIANLFQGLCLCGECGQRIRYVKHNVKNATGEKYGYLRCTSAFNNKGCDAVALNYAPIEKAILSDLFKIWRVELSGEAETITDPSIAIRAEIDEKKTQIELLMDSIEQATSKIESRSLGPRLAQREQELTALNDRLKSVVMPEPSADALARAATLYAEHQRLQGSEDRDLYDVRLKLQSVIKQFVETIVLPTKVFKAVGDRSVPEYRKAMMKLDNRWIRHMVTRDLAQEGVVATEADIAAVKSSATLKEVWYDVPRPGGQPGNQNRRGRPRKMAP